MHTTPESLDGITLISGSRRFIYNLYLYIVFTFCTLPIFPVCLEPKFVVFSINSPNHHTVLKISTIPEDDIGSSSPEGTRISVCVVEVRGSPAAQPLTTYFGV